MTTWPNCKRGVSLLILLSGGLVSSVALADQHANAREEQNKAIAKAFYNDLWLSNNTDKYADYVADTYVAHDIGDRKNVSESAIEQKEIADFFWQHGDMSGEFDYQIADGDLVATRWTWRHEPTTFFGRVLMGRTEIPIINVFRIKDGKIAEVWNHRHDIDTGMTRRFTLQGLAIGLGIALLPLLWALSLRRKLKRLGPVINN
ncbi:MAG: ester cyclase [Pseudomonadota bacterium]